MKKNDAQKELLEGLRFDWKNEYRIKQYSEKIEGLVKLFEEAVHEAIEKT